MGEPSPRSVPGDPQWPPEEAVLEVHERFVREVVEGLNLCPFARKSRELGRVHRPIFRVGGGDPEPQACSEALGELVRTHPDAEIVLLTFPVPKTHAWQNVKVFDRFVAAVRDTYLAADLGPTFYMVGFHPDYATDESRLTSESLVTLLRRSPDPVIQCVRASTLDEVRRQAQEVSKQRITRDLRAIDPELATMFEGTIQADPELGADIARANFHSVGAQAGREHLEALIADIRRQRDLAYGEAGD
jgi:hypothetical protein